MTKVSFGPMVGLQTDEGYMLNVRFQTNGDWFKTEEGEEALQAAVNALFDLPPGEKLVFPLESEVEFQNNDLAILRIPCTPDTEKQLTEQLRRELPRLTGAVYTKNTITRLP